MMESGYEALLKRLDAFVKKYYKNQLLKGGIYALSAFLVCYISVIVLEYFAHFDTTVRTVLFYGFAGVITYILSRWIILPLSGLYKLRKTISHDEAAQLIGKHFPEISDKLINTLQLQSQLTANSEETALLNASIEQRIQAFKPVTFAAAIDLSQNKKHLKYAIPPVVAFLILLFAAPSIVTEGTQRMIQHRTYFTKQAPFKFIIENEDLTTGQLDDFELAVRLEGEEIPEQVYIDLEGHQFKLQKGGKIDFNYTFKNVQRDLSFKLYADGFYSETYQLNALPTPILLNFDIRLDYPSYVQKQNETVKNTGDLIVPAGTKINWLFHTSNTEQVKVHFPDSTFQPERREENTFAFAIRALQSQSYSVITENQFMRGRDSILYALNVVPDQYPSIEVQERADSTASKRLYFKGLVKDDYGFKRLSFNYRFVKSQQEDKKNKDLIRKELSISSEVSKAPFFHFWDLNELNIEAGEEIEYYFEVWDNDAVTGSKSSRSHSKVFKAPTLKEVAKQAMANNEQIKEEMEEGIKEAKELQDELDKLHRKLLEKKELDWQDKQKIEQLLAKQKNLEQKVDKIQQQNRENLNKQNEYTRPNERILDKQRQLEALFEEIMSDEMKQKYEELQRLMEELDKDKVQEMLEDMEMDDEFLENELDRSLELFKQLEFEQQLDKKIDELDKLAEKQEELAEETEEKGSDNEEIKEKQDELNKEFDEFREEMDELEKMNEELEQPNDMDDTDKEEESIDKEMEESSDELGQNKKKKASDSQKSSSDQMKELSKKMKEMQQSMQEQKQAMDMESLRQLLDNLVKLSFDQEDLMKDLNVTDMKDPKYVSIIQEQKKLKDDAEMIEDSLQALSKRFREASGPAGAQQAMKLQAAINKEIISINSNMEKSISFLSNQPPRREREYKQKAIERQQYVMTSVNNLALMLDESLQQLQQAMSQQMFGEGSCNKPGNSKGQGQGKKSMAGMKDMQKKINDQIEKLKKQMEGGDKPGGKKGDKPGGEGMGGSGKMSKELARLAAQQEALRNELRKMSEQMDEEGSGGKGGNLDQIKKLMEETETDLVNKRITLETLQRQKDIMVKLLESEKAERERELDDKRESKEAIGQDYTSPEEFFDFDQAGKKEIELLRTVPPSLNSYYRKKVNEYFSSFVD